MRRFAALFALNLFVMTLGAGCVFTDWSLRRNVVTQASTLTELQYQQVLGNLAMMSLDPDAMPTHINIRDGSAQIQDNGVISSASPATIYPSLSGSRTLVAQWTMIPLTDDVELRILRLAYRRALGFDEELELDLANDLAHELCNRVSNSDYIDLRSDPNINVKMLDAAKLFQGLDQEQPGEAALTGLLKPRTRVPVIRWLPSIVESVMNPAQTPGNWVDIALEDNVLHLRVRVTDGNGKVVETDETKLPGMAPQIDALKRKLQSLRPPHPHKLSEDEEKEVKPLLEPIVSQYFAGQFNRHGDYYAQLTQVFYPIMERLFNLGTARVQWNITSNDDELLFKDELKPAFPRKVDTEFIEKLDTALYVVEESNGKTYPYKASPVVREARRQVKDFYVDFLKISPGWFGVGPKKAVPHDACYVGRYRQQYAWVTADGRKDLADFTIKVLNFATLIKDQSIMTVPGGPRYSPSVPTR